MRTKVLSTLGALLIVQAVSAQGSNQLVGTWERVSITNDQGVATQQSPAFVIFSANGHFSQTVVPANRPKVNKPVQEMTRDELLARFQGAQARRGTYTIQGNRLTRKDVTNADPNQEGTEQIQQFRVDGDLLILSNPTTKAEARFRRVK
jgi:hypothetical protein